MVEASKGDSLEPLPAWAAVEEDLNPSRAWAVEEGVVQASW